MKLSKYSFFMELLVGIFFFCLITMIVVQGYAKAYQIERSSKFQNDATIIATNVLENMILEPQTQNEVFYVDEMGQRVNDGVYCIHMVSELEGNLYQVHVTITQVSNGEEYQWETQIASQRSVK